MTIAAAQLARHRGSYGVDAPYVPALMGAAGLVSLAVGGVSWFLGLPGLAIPATYLGAFFVLSTADYLYASIFGKFGVWAELLASLDLEGDEQVLDMGCGRGAVLCMVARLLPRGRAVGIDLWKTADQSGNSPEATGRNAEAEGVADRIELRTGDMRAMPFPDGSFDLVISSLAIHNITDAAGRAKATDEAARVLRPGGTLLIVDISAMREYEERLRQHGLSELARRPLGTRMWFGGPWVAASLVRARKAG